MTEHKPRILIAPNKFSGSLTAGEVCAALANGLRRGGVPAGSITELPLADGGAGSVQAAIAAGFFAQPVTVTKASGQMVRSEFAFDGYTAVVEMDNSCGATLRQGARQQPLRSGSHGIGQLIRAALQVGARRIVVALGDSAGTDGAMGMLSALGLHFSDAHGQRLHGSGGELHRIARITGRPDPRLANVELVAATDVRNPLTGPAGAAHQFGPHTGADPAMIRQLESGLVNLVRVMDRQSHWQLPGWMAPAQAAGQPRAGSAGGLGFGCLVLGARATSGAQYFMDLLDFKGHATHCDLVITGEECLDAQTLAGSLPGLIAANAAHTEVVAVGARSALDEFTATQAGFSKVFTLAELTGENPRSEARPTAQLLEQLGRQLAQQVLARVPAGG
ncbi:glycerate kinase [Glutamicibacter sp. MNS18]|uniref:glycerate kinase n=1 Tax=Glutamicibacter sp. MNS18 TaxID=2989817 RepID=UPI0022359E6D|nr:glycerate kinase [Glutamicibacter sp. MNS18]MCW4465070.1 glycerate kinase [Glutamicibacter sp. MNS18]